VGQFSVRLYLSSNRTSDYQNPFLLKTRGLMPIFVNQFNGKFSTIEVFLDKTGVLD